MWRKCRSSQETEISFTLVTVWTNHNVCETKRERIWIFQSNWTEWWQEGKNIKCTEEESGFLLCQKITVIYWNVTTPKLPDRMLDQPISSPDAQVRIEIWEVWASAPLWPTFTQNTFLCVCSQRRLRGFFRRNVTVSLAFIKNLKRRNTRSLVIKRPFYKMAQGI